MNSDPKLTRAFLKYVIALKTEREWGSETLLIRAAASQGVDPEELRTYVIEHIGLPDTAKAEEVRVVTARQDNKGR